MENRNMIIIAVVSVVVVVGAVAAVTMRDTGGGGQGEEGISVALCVGAYNNPWRIQHMEQFRNVAEKMENEGKIESFTVVASGSSISDQASDIRSLAEQGTDLIVVNPNDPKALNPAIEDAHNLGSTIVSTDQHINSEHVTNVIIDQSKWFEDITRWGCEQLNGEGDIVAIYGIPGHPANDARVEGMERALEDYPDINVLAEIDGMWQYDVVQDKFSTVFANHRDEIDAVITQDGLIDGVIWALQEAGVDPEDEDWPKVMTGDHTMRFLRQYWENLATQGIKTYMRANPPGYYSTTSLKFGIKLVKGEELDTDHSRVDTEAFPGTTVWIPLGPKITGQNYTDFLEEYEDKADTYRIDYIMPDSEVEEYFK